MEGCSMYALDRGKKGKGKGKSKGRELDMVEAECVGSLEVQQHRQVGFICGTLPVTVALPQHTLLSPPHTQRVRAPRYRMLPTETDLNTLPSLGIFPTGGGGDLHGLYNACSGDPFNQPLARKCEALAVSGLAAYGDEIDVVAPVDILKQIFKIPYSKARLSVAVHRVGQTLILNTGPDVEEGEKLVRRKKNQSKGVDQSLFLNFAMHSVRAEACDCPPSAKSTVPNDAANSTIFPGQFDTGFMEGDCLSSCVNPQSHSSWHFVNDDEPDTATEDFHLHAQGSSQSNRDSIPWGGTHGCRQKSRLDSLKKARHFGEKQCCPNYVQDSEKHRRLSKEGFLRVLFWQFHNLRMLLGSDLLVFSNEKHVAVSLHLWEVERQVTPLMWLDAWLDNVMASVPELAICYHHNGVVQGYELLKTDDIFLLKGIAEDGTAIFHPQVVQQNGLSVLKFLQDNCKQDPGSYWLYKNAGEDLIQLFDLSVLSKSCSSDKDGKSCSSLPSSKNRGIRDYSLPLGILLYRVAHRLSLSEVPNDRSRCAKLFKKCLEFLNEQEHLMVRACAHEQVARLILKCYEELGSTMDIFLLESKSSVVDVEKMSSLELSSASSEPIIQEHSSANMREAGMLAFNSSYNASENVHETFSQASEPNISLEAGSDFNATEIRDLEPLGRSVTITPFSNNEDNLTVCQIGEASPQLYETVTDPISAKLAAVHHVSQAIKSLRWQRQLQGTELKVTEDYNGSGRSPHVQQLPICVCGDIDCIEVCDLREWLAGSRIDRKLWQLVLLLGESYLSLGQAYKDDGQLHRALKVGEMGCSLYGSMPSSLEEVEHASIGKKSSSELSNQDQVKTSKTIDPLCDGGQEVYKNNENNTAYGPFPCKGLFWGQAWILIGDIYVEYQRLLGEKLPDDCQEKDSRDELKMASEVMKEVKRLKKKLAQSKRNCNFCSLTDCSCQSDRVSSGNSASSSSSDGWSVTHNRKESKKANSKHALSSNLESSESDSDQCISGSANGGSSERSDSKKSRIAVQGPDDGCYGSTNEKERTRGSIETKDVERTQKTLHQLTAVSKSLKSKNTDTYIGKPRDIFSFLKGPKGDLETNLSAAAECYDAARDALCGHCAYTQDSQLATRKKGWVCNELGRWRLANRDLKSAETAFATAIEAFREVKDFTNIVLINCNLGHGRRALAESLAAKIDSYKQCGILQKAYRQTLDDVKFQYGEALKFYGAAQFELNAVEREGDTMTNRLWHEVNTQYAHTYLRLGMLLAREDISANLPGNMNWNKPPAESTVLTNEKTWRSPQKKHEIAANDAIREALVLYESMGTLRVQEAAFAHFQLASYQRDCCLKALNLDCKEPASEKCESANFQQAKRYASLAERHWQKAKDYYCAETHPDMFLQILMERSELFLAQSTYYHSNMMLESALSSLLEGKNAFDAGTKNFLGAKSVGYGRIIENFSQQLQSLLKTMLAAANSASKHSSRVSSVQSRSKKCTKKNSRGEVQSMVRVTDIGKLRELYRISLKSDVVPDLCSMYEIWAS
ncbi:hypothetical protein SUGI_0275050 [Cryptomeria japonica]|uniref:uncharacterized protein LOC131075072 n=1 Tax=Cryptomeria japonica TaxID=3369 RepID=UPI002408CB91|nr:uncharacterized protein LOC131075072 [Cryptomeria japonica]GLJ16307.1 hypothetical protein SUGI_0275050 [Cryptomeria japonica]